MEKYLNYIYPLKEQEKYQQRRYDKKKGMQNLPNTMRNVCLSGNGKK